MISNSRDIKSDIQNWTDCKKVPKRVMRKK